MKISVVIQGSPQSQSCATAFEYTKAIIESENEVYRIFFHQDGVLAGNSLNAAPGDEPRIGKLWSGLAEKTWIRYGRMLDLGPEKGNIRQDRGKA